MAKYRWGDGKGKVHSIPKSKHNANVRSGRRARRDAAANDPASIIDPLTPRALRRETAAAIRAEYGPQEREFTTAIAEGQQRQQDISGWYQNYLNAVQGSKAATEQRTVADTAAAGEPAPQMTGDFKTDQAALSRHSLNDAWQKMVKLQGESQSNAYNNQAVQAPLMELGAHQTQGRAVDKLREGLRGLKGDEGAAAIKYRADARAGERDWAATSATLQQAGVKIQNDAINDRADRRAARGERRRQARLDAAAQANTDADNKRADKQLSNAEFNAKWKRDHPAGYGKDGKPKDSAAGIRAEKNRKLAIRTTSDKAFNRVKDAANKWDLWHEDPFFKSVEDQKANKPGSYKNKAGKTIKGKTPPSILRRRLSDAGFTPDEVVLALAYKRGGVWNAKEIAAAHSLHIRVPKEHRPGRGGPGGPRGTGLL